ncbi:unnamed protein product [Meganyctiphanes norvegica]|uniref:Lipid scramblase CLPTM1L n=1 Tax=Meganyctiphanes norvegica TaxID=48144 RepID=A0AAV2Q978_MEGNR
MAGGYQLPSLTMIATGIFVAYVLHSAWTLGQLFIVPSCDESQQCLHPVLATNPKLQLLAFSSVKRQPDQERDLKLVHQMKPFDINVEQEVTLPVVMPSKVRNNGSMYLHLFLTSAAVNPDNWGVVAANELTVYVAAPLTQYQMPTPKTFNLLGESQEKKPAVPNQVNQRPVTHFQSQVVFHVLSDNVVLPRNAVPYEIGHAMRLDRNGKYLPILYISGLSSRLRDLVEVESKTKEVNLTLQYSPISYGKIRLWMQFEGALGSMTSLGFTSKDLDEVKGIFTDTNLYFLCVTFFVAALHLLFDFLAFKNDISFWRGRKNVAGISPSTVAWRAFSQFIIFFYLLDEETSYLVLIPAGVGGIIELWKVTKAFHIEMNGWRISLKGAQTDGENLTKELDQQGIKYLSYIMYPLLIVGGIYSVLYLPHKSWYSWIINMLVNGVYAFGFLFMLPQLFINYKLKSVAHLPWRAFMYKAFNTFIDDLFAFIIVMPTAHRVACFRDDIVFIIYLVQKWMYPVDKTRVNEFGGTGEEDEHEKKD